MSKIKLFLFIAAICWLTPTLACGSLSSETRPTATPDPALELLVGVWDHQNTDSAPNGIIDIRPTTTTIYRDGVFEECGIVSNMLAALHTCSTSSFELMPGNILRTERTDEDGMLHRTDYQFRVHGDSLTLAPQNGSETQYLTRKHVLLE